MGRRSLPPGFRFHPTDVELVRYYLKRKVLGKKLHFEAIAETDIYRYAPWDLPDKSLLRTGDLKWYFFCPREKKYANGARINRTTNAGYWKTTGKDRSVHYKDELAGMIKTLVFHSGKAPKGERTDWVMYEYRLQEKELADIQDSYVLCVIFKKDGPGPRNGAQYGAPFNEEEWDHDDEEEEVTVNVVETASSTVGLTPASVLSMKQDNSIITSPELPVSLCQGSPASCPSGKLPSLQEPLIVGSDKDASRETPQVVNGGDDVSYAGVSTPASVFQFTHCNTTGISSYVSCPSESLPSADKALPIISDVDLCAEDPPFMHKDDELLAMLAFFADENDNIENIGVQNFGGNFDADSLLKGVDMFNGLGEFSIDVNSNSYILNDIMDQIPPSDGEYLELMDLETPLNFSTEASGCQPVLSGGFSVDNNCDRLPNLFSATQLVPGLAQSSMQPRESHGYQGQEDGMHEKASQGHSSHGFFT